MDYTEKWRKVIEPRLDDIFKYYDRTKHVGVEFVFRDKATGSANQGLFPIAEENRPTTNEEKGFVKKAVLEGLLRNLRALDPERTQLELNWF